MDLLYESDQKLGDMEHTDMGEILDHDVFTSPSPTVRISTVSGCIPYGVFLKLFFSTKMVNFR